MRKCFPSFLLLVYLLTSAPLFGQSNYGVISGTVTDAQHRPIAGAAIQLTATSTGAIRRRVEWTRLLTQNWNFSAIYQIQTGMPFTISVFGETANSGTVLGENPVRENATGQPLFGPGTHTAAEWFNPAAFATPPAFTYGNVGRNSVYGPGMQTVDVAPARAPERKSELPIPCRSLQSLEQDEPGNAQPFRQHAAVRHPHLGDDTGTRNPVERKTFVLTASRPDRQTG